MSTSKIFFFQIRKQQVSAENKLNFIEPLPTWTMA